MLQSTSWACSGPAVGADRQDDVSRLLPRLDVPGRLDHLLQGIGAIDDRPVVPSLDELLEEDDVLLRVPRYREQHLLVTDPRRPQRQERVLPKESEVG